MDQQNQFLLNRLLELSRRSAREGTWTFSEYLNLSEQTALESVKRELETPVFTAGGYPGAERLIACFGNEEELGYACPVPIVCVRIAPKNQKFAEGLTHRDVLGSVLSLGLRREVTGDILLRENCAYLLCLDSVGEYIAANLERVKHTPVRCELTAQLPEDARPNLESAAFVIASERLDAAVAAVFRLSRAESQALFDAERVFVNGALTTRRTEMPEPGDIVSVRGLGRFLYDGVERETKKGRLRVAVRLFR